jgi:hypothetical protein
MLRNIALAAAAATIATTSMASAADLPSKKSVPTLAAAEPSAIHGFVDFSYANGMMSGGGKPLYKSGVALLETTVGLSADIYSSKTGLINSVTAFVGGWAQSWNDAPTGTARMQEYDWWAGATIGFADYYKLTVQELQFQIPNAGDKGVKVVENVTVTLSYDDAHLGLPIALNPYVNVFYNYGGYASMGLGKTGTYRVDVGIGPSYSFMKSAGVPLTLTVPAQISFGPSDMYYNGQTVCGPSSNQTCSTSTFQYAMTGLLAKYDLGQFIPKKFGSWSLKAGVKYFHIMNDGILANQVGGSTTFPAAKTNYTVFSTGLNISF